MNTCPVCKSNLTQADLDLGHCPSCHHVLHPVPVTPSGAVPPDDAARHGTLALPPLEGQERDEVVLSGLQAEPQTGGDAPEGRGPVVSPTEHEKSTAGEERIAATIQAIGPGGPIVAPAAPSGPAAGPPSEHEKGTAGDERIAATLASVGPIGPSESAGAAIPAPPSEHEKGTAGDERIAATLASVGAVGPPEAAGMAIPTPPSEHEKGTADERHIAATLAAAALPSSALARSPGQSESRRFAPTLDSGSLPPEIAARVSLLWSGSVGESATPRTSIKSDASAIEEETRLVIQSRVVCDIEVAPTMQADYELIRKLGEGGMGVVMAARQASIGRTVALKKIKPAEARKAESRQKFLTEAVVTGDLEHPNIVPIYDLGKDDSGTLFYSMKHVKGTPWDRVLSGKSAQENLETWMKVADAVAFAHSRGVIHRDLKPENVMLGDFGEVLVMDWGLALTVGSPAAKKAGMAGTPAYMAPEMALGPMDHIGFHSDIYLLGAILYEIVAGKTPHSGNTVTECLMAVAGNVIQPPEKAGELMDIAMKAMSTDPKDRYATVGDLQESYRQYRSHSESILLSTHAEDDLAEARRSEDYEYYARALFGFQEAYSLWEENGRAKAGISEATLAYAGQALKNGDFDLGAKLLDPNEPAHAALLEEIRAGQRERIARVQRLKTARRIGAALVLTILAVVSVAFFWIRAEKNIAQANEQEAKNQTRIAKENLDEATRQEGIAKKNAQAAKEQAQIAKNNADRAEKNATEAKRQEGIAKDNAIEAKKQEGIAIANAKQATANAAEAKKQEGIAKDNELKAVNEKNEAEYRGYIARIGLAAAKIEENAFDRAETLLKECPDRLRNWEWGRLMYLCTEGSRTVNVQDPIEALAFTRDGRRFATGGWGGTVRVWDAASRKMLQEIPSGGDYVFALAFSPDGRNLAVGSNARPNYIEIWDWQNRRAVKALPGHANAVLSLAYSNNGQELLSGSYDNTARLWNIATGGSRLLGRHEWWVCSAAYSPDERQVVTACQDGSVSIWDIGSDKPAVTFLGHTGPVYAAVFSPDGKWVASAGYDKRVLVWQPVPDSNTADRATIYSSLDAHSAGVRALLFSADGNLLVSAGHDNTVRLWDFPNRKLKETLRGHAGRVRAIAMAPPPNAAGADPSHGQVSQVRSQLISGGHDRQVKIWDIQGYRETIALGADIVPAHREPVLGASFSPRDGRSILSASRDRTVRLWDRITGTKTREFQQGHQYLVTTAIFFPQGTRFLTAAVDNSTRVWDVASGVQLMMLDRTGVSAAAAISADGSRIATGSDRKTAKLWDALTGTLLGETPDHQAEVTAVAFSPDGARLFTGDEVGHCRLWDIASRRWLWEVQKHSEGVKAACFLPDGKRILTASTDRTVAQWDAKDGTELIGLTLGHPNAVTSMVLARDGRHVLTTCSDGKARLWDVDQPARPAAEFGVANETINLAAFSPDQAFAVTTSSKAMAVDTDSNAELPADKAAAGRGESYVRLWDLKTMRQVAGEEGPSSPFLPVFAEANTKAWATIFAPDGGSLLTVMGNEARLFNLKSRRESMAFIPQGAMASARFSPDGKRAVTGSWDKTACIWNIDKGLVETRLVGHEGYVNDAAFSPDGKYVATAGRDNQAILWDAATGKAVHHFTGNDGHRGPVTSVAFDSKGERLITASQDRTARIWDLKTRRLLVVLGVAPPQTEPDAPGAIRVHAESVLSAIFSPDGTSVLTAGEDSRAIVWDAASGKPIQQLQGHTAAITSVSISPDGKRAVTGSRDGTAKLWELQEGNELITLKGHSQDVTTVAFSDDGKQLLTGSLDGTIILWPASAWGVRVAMPKPDFQKNPPLARR